MPCAHPRRQWRVEGKWSLVEPLSPSLHEQQQIACGQCAPCRSSRAGAWTVRLVQNGQMFPASICTTATYDPAELPPDGSLRKSDISKFIKALRQVVARRGGERFSFDCYGEYSPAPLMRPHYHLGLFGYYPPDSETWAKSGAGNQEYVSAELSKAWGRGLITFQPWDYGAAQYCAGHQAWKLTGELGRHARLTLAGDGATVVERAPEFHLCSSRPGIGRLFFEAHGEQALRLGFTLVNGKRTAVPGYYLRRGEVDMPELAESARAARRAAAELESSKLEGEYRLDAIEVVAQARIDRASRKGRFS